MVMDNKTIRLFMHSLSVSCHVFIEQCCNYIQPDSSWPQGWTDCLVQIQVRLIKTLIEDSEKTITVSSCVQRCSVDVTVSGSRSVPNRAQHRDYKLYFPSGSVTHVSVLQLSRIRGNHGLFKRTPRALVECRLLNWMSWMLGWFELKQMGVKWMTVCFWISLFHASPCSSSTVRACYRILCSRKLFCSVPWIIQS